MSLGGCFKFATKNLEKKSGYIPYNTLHWNKLRHRNYVEMSISEKMYLSLFAMGDLNVRWHGRKIRAIVGTTHPSMIKLVLDSFGEYGRIMIYPASGTKGYGWRLACDLPARFAFLTRKNFAISQIDRDPDSFFPAISGFSDAEGTRGPYGTRREGKSAIHISQPESSGTGDFQEGAGVERDTFEH